MRLPRLLLARGFTLVELMVGLTVGLFVVMSAVSIFVSTRTLQTVSTAESRMGENARLAMDLLKKDFRSAGFQGCHARDAGAPVTLLNGSGGLFLDSGTLGVAGSHGNGSTFTPTLNTALSGLAQPPLADSDVVSLRVPVEPLSLGLAAPMTVSTGSQTVGASPPIAANDVLLIASCKAATIFQVSAVTTSTGALAHAVVAAGASSPGNASADLQQVFRGDASVYKLQTHHYYVANSVQQSGTKSLWRYDYPTSGSSAQEVVQGVDRMVITFGIDNGSQAVVNVSQYLTADNVPSWDSVAAVRVQLLMATVKNGVTLSSQPASFAGATVTPTDKRFRTQVTEVVTLRNRAP